MQKPYVMNILDFLVTFWRVSLSQNHRLLLRNSERENFEDRADFD
jgi:hypothetical protein